MEQTENERLLAEYEVAKQLELSLTREIDQKSVELAQARDEAAAARARLLNSLGA
jgi:hypothetical protein